MFRRILRRFRVAEERGFTLIEVAAGVVIMSVVGMALLNFYGDGATMISRQTNEMNTRDSARAVLTRMVKDIQQAPQIALSSDGSTVDIEDDQGNLMEKYVFDAANQEIYAEKGTQKTFLIHAIQSDVYAMPLKNELGIKISVKVGTSVLDFTDTVMVRSVNYNTSPVPVIYSVTTPVNTSNTGSDEDDVTGHGDGDDAVDQPKEPFEQIHVVGTDTHFTAGDTYVVLVPHGLNLNAPGNVVIQNNGASNHIVDVKSTTDLYFDLPYSDVTPQYYDVYAITPNKDLDGTISNNLPEEAAKINGLQVINQQLIGTEKDDEESSYQQPDKDQWNDGGNDGQPDWLVSGGSSFNSFGSIAYNKYVITKKSNCNNKIAYYNHEYAEFDYKATIDITDGAIDNSETQNPDSIALLTLWYNGKNNTVGGGGDYVGVGIDKDYVYVGSKGNMQRIPGYTLSTQGQATIEAVSDFDLTNHEYRLQIYVDGTLLYTSYQLVPWSGGYLGVTVNNTKTDATFTISTT